MRSVQCSADADARGPLCETCLCAHQQVMIIGVVATHSRFRIYGAPSGETNMESKWRKKRKPKTVCWMAFLSLSDWRLARCGAQSSRIE